MSWLESIGWYPVVTGTLVDPKLSVVVPYAATAPITAPPSAALAAKLAELGSTLQGAYFAHNYDVDSATWNDASAAAKPVAAQLTTPSAQVSVVTTSGRAGYAYLVGDAGAAFVFPQRLPSKYTLVYLARYDPTSPQTRRIFQSANWYSGFDDSKTGVAFHGARVTSQSAALNIGDWMLASDSMNRFRVNGVDVTAQPVAGSAWPAPLSINGSDPTLNSAWNVACVLLFDTELSDAAVKEVEASIRGAYAVTLNAPLIVQGPVAGAPSPSPSTSARAGPSGANDQAATDVWQSGLSPAYLPEATAPSFFYV